MFQKYYFINYYFNTKIKTIIRGIQPPQLLGLVRPATFKIESTLARSLWLRGPEEFFSPQLYIYRLSFQCLWVAVSPICSFGLMDNVAVMQCLHWWSIRMKLFVCIMFQLLPVPPVYAWTIANKNKQSKHIWLNE